MGEPLDETISFLKDEFETTQKPLTIAEVVKHYDDFWEEQGYQDKRFTDSQTFYGVRFMVGFDHISAILTGVKETDFATDNIWAKNFGQDGKIDYPKNIAGVGMVDETLTVVELVQEYLYYLANQELLIKNSEIWW